MKTEVIVADDKLVIINRCQVCHVAMADIDNMPYVLPFNFAYENDTLFLHCGKEGKKNAILRNNPNICVAFTIEKDLYIQSPEIGCSYSMLFESVLLFGKIEEVTDFEEKKEALHRIMHKYTPKKNYSFAKPSIDNVLCLRMTPEKMTGRKRGK